MTTEVFTLSPDTSCREALGEFRCRKIRRSPVMEFNRLAGIVSERDLLRILPGTCAQASTPAGEDVMSLPVRHIMRELVVTIGPNDHLAKAASLMLRNRIGGIPVVHEGALRGIITESDVFKALHGMLTACTGAVVIFEEPASDGGSRCDYVAQCLRHGCRLHTLLRYPTPNGGAMFYLCIDGKNVDGFIRELWTRSKRVVMVEKK
jgi:acetoin utilization protein AcuB